MAKEKKIDNRIPINFKLDPKLANEMKHFCVDNRLKISDFLSQAIKEKLNKY